MSNPLYKALASPGKDTYATGICLRKEAQDPGTISKIAR
jgi:hypothetical protein